MKNEERLPTIPLLSPDDVVLQETKKLNTIVLHPTEDTHDDDVPALHGEDSSDEQFTKLDPDHAISRYVLIPRCKDGLWFCAKILEWVDKCKNDLEMKRAENFEYKVLVGHNDGEQWEEIVAYNDLVQMIQDEGDGEEGMWRFKEIQAHQGPLSPSDQAYKGSRWNILVAWETGEVYHGAPQERTTCVELRRNPWFTRQSLREVTPVGLA